MDTTTPKILRFSTDDYPEHKRIEAYREIFSRIIIKHDVEPVGHQPFRFKATLCSLPGLGLASSVISPCRRWLGPQHLESEDFVLTVSLGGGCNVQQLGREATIGEGESMLTTCAEVGTVGIRCQSRPVSVRLPDSILRSRIPDIDALVSRKIPRSAESRLLTAYIAAIWSVESLIRSELRDIVVTHVHDLACLVLGARGEARELAEQGGARAARRLAVVRAIDNHIADPGLSAVTVANLLDITPRYVHLLLEGTGQSFTHHVLEKRLEKAAALLRDPRWQHRKIADIAAESGFNDLSYFNRAFRRHFGATPSDMREAARRGE